MATPRELGNLGDAAGSTAPTTNVNIDVGTLFVNGTNNRVGVNTTNPGSTLEVVGSGRFTTTLSVANTIAIATDNTTGGGIIFADDGDIVDLNDAWCSMRFTGGVRVYSGNKTGTPRVALGADGQVVANSNITAYGNASDINQKENIIALKNSLENISKLTGYSFNYKGDEQKLVGVIAQEVEKVYPELVYTYRNLQDEEALAVRYSHLTAVLIEAVKELKARVEDLESKVNQQ